MVEQDCLNTVSTILESCGVQPEVMDRIISELQRRKSVVGDRHFCELELCRQLHVSMDILEIASGLLKRGLISLNEYSGMHGPLLEKIYSSLKGLSRAEKQANSDCLEIKFYHIVFNQPLVLENLAIAELSFEDCQFRKGAVFTAVNSANTITFQNCHFFEGFEIVLRMLRFPKPEVPQEWEPSLAFYSCHVSSIVAFRVEAFLFFSDSSIDSSSFELPKESIAQFVNCTINDGIIYAVDPKEHGHNRVPKWWYKDVGWFIE